MPKRPPSVEIEWIDAVDRDFSGTIAAAIATGKLARRFQSGYLIHQDEKILILAQTYDPPDNSDDEAGVDRLTVIPVGWVVKIHHKRKPRLRKVLPGETPAPSPKVLV